ncbi:MAG: ATP-binding protein [Actinomycetia bacterium]|nr:ATP-binding protein [Actinomycetes bacterium]
MMKKKEKDLLNFVSNLAGENYLKIEEDLGEGFVKLKIDEAEKRQAKHDIREVEDVLIELLRNARDAGATKIFIATRKRNDSIRELIVIDNGCGIPAEIKTRVFEPRVTSKLNDLRIDRYGVHGRGMALFAVKHHSESVKIINTAIKKGSVFKVEIDTVKLPEKTNQSTLPNIVVEKNNIRVSRGINNLWRIIIEFWIDSQDLEIYFGSPAEIISTMIKVARKENEDIKTIWSKCRDIETAKELMKAVKEFYGINLSERNIYRVINSEIESLLDIKNYLIVALNIKKKISSGKKISREDMEIFSKKIEREARKLAKKYLLGLNSVRIRQESDKIKITVNLKEKDNI